METHLPKASPLEVGGYRQEVQVAGVILYGDDQGDRGRAGDVPDLDLDVADLGAAYLGGTRFEDLRAADRVRELVPGAVRRADRMFAADRTPSCSTMF